MPRNTKEAKQLLSSIQSYTFKSNANILNLIGLESATHFNQRPIYEPILSDPPKITELYFSYAAKLNDEHIKEWGFGLCFLYLRNVKRFIWNHKHVYCIYRDLELSLRTKPME